MTSAIAINLYKIDTDRVREVLGETKLKIGNMPKKLVERYNLTRLQNEGRAYGPIAQANEAQYAKDNMLSFYEKERQSTVTHNWKNFFDKADIDLGQIKSATPNIVCFAVLNDELFAVTTGSANVVFESYIDQVFPIELAKHILNAEVKGGKQQAISGVVQATDIYFRNPTRINIATSHQDVWQNLSGNVSRGVLESEAFVGIFGVRRSVSIEIKASVKISAKIEHPRHIISLLEWVQSILDSDLTPEQKAAFSFYDSIRPLTMRKDGYHIGKLTETISSLFMKGSDSGLNLSHDETSRFVNAETYSIRYGNNTVQEWEYTPDPDEVKDAIKRVATEGLSDREVLEKAKLYATYEDQHYLDTQESVLRHLNGELLFEGKTYYLLNGKWFQVDESYLGNTKLGLIEILSNPLYVNLSASDLTLAPYNHTKEGTYNEAHGSATMIYADQVFYKNIELADLIGFGGSDNIDIIHVKRGFAGSIRDVTSQLRNSMNSIENDINISGNPLLKQYYATLVSNGRVPSNISEQDFISLFKGRKRRYVMAYTHKTQLTKDNVDSYSSSIAKNETVALAGFSRQFSQAKTSFHIVWVKDEKDNS